MAFYHLTLQQPTSIFQSIKGNFIQAGKEDLVVSNGRVLTLYCLASHSLIETTNLDTFGFIKSVCLLRLPSEDRDLIAVLSDGGFLSLIKFNSHNQKLDCVLQQKVTEKGFKRTQPGQMMISQKQTLLISAIESSLLALTIQKATSKYSIEKTISFKSQRLCSFFLDVCWSSLNDTFFTIEIDCKNSIGTTNLVEYQIGNQFQNIQEKKRTIIDKTSNLIINVPNNEKFKINGGLIMCAEEKVSYFNQSQQEEKSISIPIRENCKQLQKCQNINCGIYCFSEESESNFLKYHFLLQNDLGDLYKLILTFDSNSSINNLMISYFDTIPISTDLILIGKNYLFSSSNFSTHFYYKITNWGNKIENEMYPTNEEEIKMYKLNDELKSLNLINDLVNISPLIDCQISQIQSQIETNQSTISRDHFKTNIYCLTGTSMNSTVQMLEYGIPITELNDFKIPIEDKPTGIWTLKSKIFDQFHEYLIISFSSFTLLFQINGKKLIPILETNLLDLTVQTLQIQLMLDNSVIQIYPNGIRHMKQNEVVNWSPLNQQKIDHCVTNPIQIAISINNTYLAYFELLKDGNLPEIEKIEFQNICSMDLITNFNFTQINLKENDNIKNQNENINNNMEIETEKDINLNMINFNHYKSPFLIIGTNNNYLFIVSLFENAILHTITSITLESKPESVSLIKINTNLDSLQNDGNSNRQQFNNKNNVNNDQKNDNNNHNDCTYFLNIGLENGILIQYLFNKSNIILNKPIFHQLNTNENKKFKFIKCQTQNENSIILISDSIWLISFINNKFLLAPLNNLEIEDLASFNQKEITEGFFGINSENILKYFSIEQNNKKFQESIIKLKTTPRKMITHQKTGTMFIILRDFIKTKNLENKNEQDYENEKALNKEKSKDIWDSKILIIHPNEPNNFLYQQFLEKDEIGYSISILENKNIYYLVVGSACSVTLKPRSCKHGYITIFKILDDSQLKFITKIKVPNIPYCIQVKNNHIIAGIGSSLIIFQFIRNQIFIKTEFNNNNSNNDNNNDKLLNFVVSLSIEKDLIFVGDITKSIFIFQYSNNKLKLYAKDNVPRFITTHLTSKNLLFAGDKFGNLLIYKIPEKKLSNNNFNFLNQKLSLSSTFLLNDLLNDSLSLNLDKIGYFHIGEMINSIQQIQFGGSNLIFYSTILGTFGILIDITSNIQINFFSQLQMLLKKKIKTVSGNDNLDWRSYYFPHKGIIDGDFSELFFTLKEKDQLAIAEKMEIPLIEILKQLQNMRNKIL
ncbi:splicing factor 3b subunit 3 [Anaeramoeba flamelloides]|uniref:Splicing factor 3b subunit 3 n=1 Tax=Anaeramoeba flamelloides TaxID=1746091 RepID=A0ABQ8YVC5_9EUKA|nr:splicing factor 3b subunit 3 [Anaeramoeba flamelloides]